LDSPDFNTLLKVIEGAALTEECAALEDMAKQAIFEGHAPSVIGHMKEAKRYRETLEVLVSVQSKQTHEIATSITPFTT